MPEIFTLGADYEDLCRQGNVSFSKIWTIVKGRGWGQTELDRIIMLKFANPCAAPNTVFNWT